MEPPDLVGKIDHLLQKPLLSAHIRYLNSIRKKAEREDLIEFDRDYVLYLWDEFGPSASKKRVEELNTLRSDNSGTGRVKRETKPSINTKAPSAPVPAGVETELDKAKQTIARLRETGKRAVAQRDHWAAVAKTVEQELADLRRQSRKVDIKFEEAKRAFAKLYHPNASASRSPLEAMVRTEIFKEFWAELERIESQT